MLLIACKGFNSMHVVERTHAIQPIQHTHQGEDKKQVQLGLNMYFDKLKRVTTNTHLKIKHIPKKTMCMLADELDEGVELIHRLQQSQEFASTICHHDVHAHYRGRPSLESAHQLHHHKHVKEFVSPQRTKCK